MITIRDNAEQESFSESSVQARYRVKLGLQANLLRDLQQLSDLCDLPVITLYDYLVKLDNDAFSKDGYATYKEALLDQHPELFL